MVNRENIDRVIAAIEAEEAEGRRFGFDMRDFLGGNPSCGTAACIAGVATLLAHPEVSAETWRLPEGEEAFPPTVGREFLGLSRDQGSDLFVPHEFRLKDITRQMAVAVLKHLRDTGEVDWSVADEVTA